MASEDQHTGVRIVVGIVCVLTVLGSVVIIASYLCFRTLRTKARLLLVHLSAMDLLVGVSNLTGLLALRRYHDVPSDYFPLPLRHFCTAQAFVADYATISSVLWTVSLGVYMYVLASPSMVERTLDRRFVSHFVWVSCLVSYGLPTLVTMWLLLTGRLGYTPEDSAGWCSVVTYDNVTGKDNTFVSFFGYDLWMYLAISLIAVLYIASKANLRYQAAVVKGTRGRSVSDYKFALIPIIFLFLRMWTAIQSLLLQITAKIPDQLDLPLLYLTGIGDSAQGFANAVLFVCLTKAVRAAFMRAISCKSCRKLGLQQRPSTKLLPTPFADTPTTNGSQDSNVNCVSVHADGTRDDNVP